MALLYICANLYHVRLNRKQLGSRSCFCLRGFEISHVMSSLEHYTESQKTLYLRVEKKVLSEYCYDNSFNYHGHSGRISGSPRGLQVIL